MILFCNMFRWTCSKLMYISVFKFSMLTLLNAFATWCRIWFWSVSNLHSLLNSSSSLSRWYQIDASNAIFDLTTAEYTCFIFVKIALHMKTSRWLSISIFVTWLTFIYQRCVSHYSFMFSWISKTLSTNSQVLISQSHAANHHVDIIDIIDR